METKVENPQNLSVPLSKSSTLQNQLELNLHGVENNTILEWNHQIVGYISIKNDTFFLKLVETAPKIIISAFPRQRQVLFEVANTIEIRSVDSNYLEVLAIEANSIYFLANAEATKDIGLTARKSLTVSGSLIAENIHNKAANIINTGKLEAKQTLTLDAQEEIQQVGKLKANTLIFRGNSAIINKKSETIVSESSVIVADTVVLEGDFHPGDNLLCKSRDLTIACPVSNLGSICIETDIFQINNAGKIELNTSIGAEDIREIVARSLVVDKGGRLKGNNLILSSEHIVSRGELDLDHSKMDVKSLELAGDYIVKNGSCVVENKAVLAGNNTSVLAHLEFEAESITFLGNNKNQDVNFITDDVLFAETSAPEFTDSSLEVAYLVSLNDKATIKLKNTFINTDAIHFSGTAILENCIMECSTLITSEKTRLDASKILAEDFWQDAGAQINNCEIKAQSTTLQQQTFLQHCKLETNMLGYEGTGYVTESDIHVFNYIHGSKNSNLTFQHSFVKSGQNYSQGILNLTEGSYYQTDYMQQSAGSIRVNGSVIDNKELLYTFTGTTLIAESKGELQLKTALFEGDTTWNASKMQSVGPVIFCGKVAGENAVISSKDSIYFSSGQHQLEKSTIVSEKVIAASSDLSLDRATLSCKSLVLNKDTLIKNSQIDVDDLNIISKFCAQKSLINLKSALYAFQNSSTSLEGVKIFSQSMYYGGNLDAKASELVASENVNFAKDSVSGFEIVKLEAGKNIINQTGSQLNGKSIETKSKYIINQGSITLDNFSAQARTIRNTGEISTKQLQFRASVGMLNSGEIESDYIKGQSSLFFNIYGSMHSKKNTTIQAPLCLNLFSSLASDASLNIDSVVHFNLPGSERAFDINIRSALDFNYGLRLSSLPGSLEDVFTLSRAVSFTRMTLTQMLPVYSNLISLGAMAIPYAKKSTGFFYDFWKSDSSFSSLPYKIYDLTRSSFVDGLSIKDASDLLPAAMNIMSTGLSAAQFTRCASGAIDEISARQHKSVIFSNEGDKALASEKSMLNLESIDLSNLFHTASEIAIKTLGPSMNIQTMAGYNGGITASVNLTESSYNESNFGVKCGWNITGDYKHLVNRGVFAGANVTATGKSCNNSGTFVSSQKAALLFSEELVNKEGGYLNLSNFSIKSKEVINAGSLNLNRGRLEAENLTSKGQTNLFTVEAHVSENINFGETSVSDFKTVKLDAGEKIINQAGSRLDGTVMEIKSASLTNDGSIALNNFSIRSKEVVNAGNLNLSNGKLEADHLTSTGHATLSTVAAHVSEDINFAKFAVSDFKTVKLESGKNIINQACSRLDGTVMEIKAASLTNDGSIALNNFSIRSKEVVNAGNLNLSNGKLEAEHLNSTGHATLSTVAAHVSEDINFAKTSVSGFKTVKLEAGKSIINQAGSRLDGTVMEFNSTSLTNHGFMAIDNFSIQSKQIVNVGNLNLNIGKLKAAHLTSTGMANLFTVEAHVLENINFGKTSVSDFKTVKLEAGKNIINQAGSRLDGTVMEIKAASLTNDGSIALDNFSIRSKEVLNAGSLNLSRGKLEAEHLSSTGHATLSTVAAHASENINFGETSVSDFQTVKLDAGQSIINQVGSRLGGTALEMKSTYLTNHGSIAIDNFSTQTSTLRNTGEISTKQFQYRASLGVLNTGSIESDYIKGQSLAFLNIFGRVHSKKSTFIQAPLYLNLFSDLASDASLNIDSLFHFNVLSSERAFDMNIRSLLDFNYGLRLLSLPGSAEDIFTLSRAVSFSRMALTQMLPGYSNVISLGSMVIPYAKKSASYLYDFWNSDSPLSALPYKIYDSARSSLNDFVDGLAVKDASDLLPNAMNIMSTGLSAAQFTRCASGAIDEISARQDKSVIFSNEGDKALALEKSVLNLESIDLSNLFHTASEIAIKTLGPSMNIQTMAGYNGGITASVNLTESSYNESNFGVKCGWNITGDYKHLVNRGVFAGANVIATGKTWENSGSFISSQKSALLFSEKLINTAGGKLNLDNFSIRSKEVVNAGTLMLNKGRLDAENLTSSGYANLSNVAAHVSENITFAGTSISDFKSVKLEAGKNIINQTGSIINGSVMEIKSSSLINKGLMTLDNFAIQSKELVNDGNLNLSSGKLEAEYLTNTGHAKLSSVTAHVSEDVNFGNASFSDFERVKLEAGKSIVTQAGSRLEGTALEVKTTSLTNQGSVAIDNLSINASTIYNAGKISTKQLQFRASVGMLNTGSIESDYIKGQSTVFLNILGRVHSKYSTVIQAPLLLNMSGDLSSNGSLNIDSLAHFNLLGSERAFDMNIRSLLDFNYGLRLPTLSSSLGEVFTLSRAMNFARMGIAQILPNYSNVISLGAMSLPYTQKSASYLYDFWKSDAPLNTLPHKIYDLAQSSLKNYVGELVVRDASDLLPLAMNIMSTGLGVKQFAMCAKGALDEIKSVQQNNNGIFSSEEKSSATTEPVEILNLFHAAGEIAIKAFGPSINIQTVLGHSAGLAASFNLTESSFYESNFGVKYGWNLIGDYKHGLNRGIFAGTNVVLTGKTWENSGIVISSQKAALLFSDKLINTDGSYLDLNNFSIRTKEFGNTGNINLSHGRLEAEHLTSTGTANLSAVAVNAQQATLKGQYRLMEQSTLIAKNLVLENEGLIKQSTVTGYESIQQTGHLVAEESFIHGKRVSLSGVEATDGKISAEHELVITKSNTFGTGLSAENADLSHSSFRGRKNEPIQPTISEKSEAENEFNPSSANTIEITEHLKTDNVLIEDMTVVSGSHSDTGSIYKDSNLKSIIHFTGTGTTLERTFAESSNVSFSGSVTIKDSQVKAENNLIQEGICKANDSIFIGKTIDMDGLNAIDGKIIAKEQLDIKNTKTYGTAIGAKNANLKNSTFEGRKTDVSEENDDYASIGTASGNNAEPGGNQIKIESNLNTQNVVMKNMQISSTTHTDQNGTYRKTHGVTTSLKSNNSKFKDRSTYKARDIKLSGQTTVNSSALIAERKMTQQGNLKGKEALLSGNNVTIDGVNLTKSTIQAEQYLKIKNANTLDTGISGKKLDLQDSVFKATPPSEESIHTEPKPESGSGNEVLPNTTTANQPEDIAFNQIHASESLNTKNVIFEGQSINAHTMTLDHSTMKSSVAKVATNTIIQNSNIGTSYIETNKANIKGNNSISETLIKAKDTIIFEKTGHLKTHNAEFDAGNHITHHSNNHEQTGSLLFKARNVESTTTTNLYSGKGEENAFFVQSETGNFQGKMRLDNGSFEVKHLKNAEDLIGQKGQSKNQEFSKFLAVNTEASITIENMKPRACDLAVKGQSIQINSDYKSDHDLDFIATDGKIKINANVSGNKVVLKSEKSDIEVNGKTVTGETYVYAEAAQDIKIRAKEREYEGKYSKEKEYFQGNIVGGAGNEDTGGAGIILKAGNKAVIDASNVIAEGKTIISGDKGVEFKARSHEFISERKSHNKRVLGIKHGKKKTERTETRISTSTIFSLKDQAQIISSEGAVKGIARNFIAARGTDIYAHKDIELKSLITDSKVRKRETGAFGLNSSKKNETHQNVKLVEFVSESHETRLHSNEGNIKGTDLRFSGCGNVRFETPQGTTKLRASKLNHSIKTSERKFSVSTPIVDTVKDMKDDKKRVIRQAEPLMRHTEALFDANTPVEMLTSTTNIAVNGYNLANTLIEGTYGQQLLQGIGFVPKINLTMTQTDTSSQYQTGTGAGFFLEEGDVSFVAKGAVDLVGMPIIADNLSIKADKVRMCGQVFESSYDMKSTSVTVGVNVSGNTDASISHASQQMRAGHYQNLNVQIKNHINIEANDMLLDAANLSCNTIDMKVDVLTVKSRQDELQQESKSASASTTGAVSMNQAHTRSQQVNKVAGIHVKSGITKENMQVGEANLIGGVISTDGHNGFEPEKLKTTTLRDSSHTRGFGISGNLDSITNALNSDQGLPSRLTTVNLSHTKMDYKVQNLATVFGKEGVNSNLLSLNPDVNTSSQARRVTYDKSQRIELDVPVEVVKSSVQAGLNFFKPATQRVPTFSNEQVRSVIETAEEVYETSIQPSAVESLQIEEISSEGTETIFAAESVVEEPGNIYIPLSTETVLENPSTETSYTPEEADTIRNMEAFNPDPHTQTVGVKDGRNRQQLYNKENGQYTNLEKELQISADNSHFTTSVELTLMEGGNKAEGYYYEAKIDPLANQLVINAELGKQYTFNIDANGMDLNYFGSMSYTVDAFSAQALIKTQIDVDPTSATGTLGGELGIMGPSAGVSYSTPELNLMGLTFQLTTDISGGVGLKATGAIGGEVNINKMKASGVAKLGLFSGPGAEVKIKPSIGIDMKLPAEIHKAYQEIVEEDAYGMSLIEKMKNWEILTPYEHDYFDTMMDEVGSKAQASRWFSK